MPPKRVILRDNDLINFFKPSLYTMFTRIRPDENLRFSETAYEPIAAYLQSILDNIIMNSKARSRTKVTLNDVQLIIDNPNTELGKRCNAKKKIVSNCYFFPKTGMNRLIRQLAQSQSYKPDMPISLDAFAEFHMYIEDLAKQVLLQSMRAMAHAKRVTIMDSDVMMAVSCMYPNSYGPR